MFLKRTSLNRNKVPIEKQHQSEDQSSSDKVQEDNSKNGIELSGDDSSSFYNPEDSNTSFRRGLRDGSITNNIDISSSGVQSSQKKGISNLSFMDSLIEDDFDNIRLRRKGFKKGLSRRTQKGIDMSKSIKSTKYEAQTDKKEDFYMEFDGDLSKNEEENTEEESEIVDDNFEQSTHSEEDHENLDSDVNMDEDFKDKLFEISDDEDDFDIEVELSQIVNSVEEELLILRNNYKSNEIQIKQNSEKLSELELEQIEVEDELGVYFDLLDKTKFLINLSNSKIPELSLKFNKIKGNRVEETEYLLRMRRWLYCDFLRMGGVTNLDYSCGDLEDIDEMGKDLSKSVEKGISKRVERLSQLNGNFVKESLKNVQELKVESLESYLNQEVRDLFTLKLGSNYTLSELSDIYDYHFLPEDVDVKSLIDEIPEKYLNIETSLQIFNLFKKNNPEEYESFELSKKLKNVFVFYVKLSLLSWDPFKNSDFSTLDWFKQLTEIDNSLLSYVVDEVLFNVSLDCIEYFDIESHEQSLNLSKFLTFVLQNSSENNKSKKAEKVTTTLWKSLQTKVSLLTVKIESEDGTPTSKIIKDSSIKKLIKFSIINLISNLVCFSDILSNSTLATLSIDELFIKRLLPLLEFDSSLDAFIVLNFKVIIEPLKKHLQIKTKNNSIVKLTLQRFCESHWNSDHDSEVFRKLSFPMDRVKYSQLINL